MDSEATRARRIAELRRLLLFELLSDTQLAWLLDCSKEISVSAGQRLFSAGEIDPGFYVLLEGELQIISDAGGRDRIVASSHRPGTYAGAMPLVDESPPLGARMSTDGRVLRIPDPVMREMLVNGYPIAKHFLVGAQDRARYFQSVADHQEKLASLGKLAAGLAHELNNPAAAAARSAAELERVIEELGSVNRPWSAAETGVLERMRDYLQQHGTALPQVDALEQSDREEAIADWLDELGMPDPWSAAFALVSSGADLPWLEEESSHLDPSARVPALRWLAAMASGLRLTREIKKGTARISELVGAVKSFTYMDTQPYQEVDLHQQLDVTLALLRHKIGGGVRVERRYDRRIPPVYAHGGEMNQVWMNLLDNALDAINGSGTIVLSTSHDGGGVRVEILDDGPGIPSEIADRIFDPFFTTKEVGEGAGLGLDLANRIVAQGHGGHLTFDSAPGCTTFRVWLPVRGTGGPA